MRIELTGECNTESGRPIGASSPLVAPPDTRDRIVIRIKPNADVDAEQRRQDRVVIAAAVAALFGSPAAIRRIRPVPGHGAGAWNREGRLAVQRSHIMPAALIRQGRDRGEGKT